jgi:hypothetical protein
MPVIVAMPIKHWLPLGLSQTDRSFLQMADCQKMDLLLFLYPDRKGIKGIKGLPGPQQITDHYFVARYHVVWQQQQSGELITSEVAWVYIIRISLYTGMSLLHHVVSLYPCMNVHGDTMVSFEIWYSDWYG